METLSDLRNRLVLEEGLRLKPYRCTSGKLTIGVGRNLEDKGITEQEAMIMLDADIQYFQFQLATKIKGWKDIHITARLVLIDMAFNMGVAGLLKFKNKIVDTKVGVMISGGNIDLTYFFEMYSKQIR